MSNGSGAGVPPPDHRLARAGWHVHGWVGERIGTIADVAHEWILVRLNSIDAREVRISAAHVASVDVGRHRVTLSVDPAEIGLAPSTERPDLSGQGTA